MGAASPKPIDVNIHLNIIQNGEKKIITTSIDKNRNIYVFNNISDINAKKEMINKRVEEGYFPLFFQLDKEKPLFLFIKNYETMKVALEEYKNLKGINDGNKEYTLYNKETKKVIPQNVPIKDLGLKYFIYISNNKQKMT